MAIFQAFPEPRYMPRNRDYTEGRSPDRNQRNKIGLTCIQR